MEEVSLDSFGAARAAAIECLTAAKILLSVLRSPHDFEPPGRAEMVRYCLRRLVMAWIEAELKIKSVSYFLTAARSKVGIVKCGIFTSPNAHEAAIELAAWIAGTVWQTGFPRESRLRLLKPYSQSAFVLIGAAATDFHFPTLDECALLMRRFRRRVLKRIGSNTNRADDLGIEIDAESVWASERYGQNVASVAKLNHDDEFRMVQHNGQVYRFTPMQASCVRTMYESAASGLPFQPERSILRAAKSTADRLRDVFRNSRKEMHPAWGTLIVRDSGRDARFGLHTTNSTTAR